MLQDDELSQGALPPPGRLVADDDGERVQCHLCGSWWPKLGTHISRGHGMSPVEYREQFGLNAETPLIRPALQRKLATLHREHLARVRPKESVSASMTQEERVRNASRLRRLEWRRHLSEGRKRYLEDQSKKPKPAPLSKDEV